MTKPETIPQKIVRLRKAHSLTQAELAAVVGVHRITVTRWETGEIDLDAKNIRRLAAALDCSPDVLLP
jgi:transcriptional regulator with XRE-family HTH domain